MEVYSQKSGGWPPETSKIIPDARYAKVNEAEIVIIHEREISDSTFN